MKYMVILLILSLGSIESSKAKDMCDNLYDFTAPITKQCCSILPVFDSFVNHISNITSFNFLIPEKYSNIYRFALIQECKIWEEQNENSLSILTCLGLPEFSNRRERCLKEEKKQQAKLNLLPGAERCLKTSVRSYKICHLGLGFI